MDLVVHLCWACANKSQNEFGLTALTVMRCSSLGSVYGKFPAALLLQGNVLKLFDHFFLAFSV